MLANHVAEKLQIQFEIEIDASPEQVWKKLASLEGMNQWLSKRLIFEFHEGGRFHMDVRIPDEGEFEFFGEVVKIETNKELAFTWTEHEKGKSPWPISTLVSFKLFPTKTGTRVTLLHSGFEALQGDLAQREYEGHIIGWERSAPLQGLKESVEGSL